MTQVGSRFLSPTLRCVVSVAAIAALAGCAALEPEGPPSAEKVWAISANHQLIKFNGGQPKRILERRPVRGLPFGESVVGMDYRVARGVLYVMTDKGRLYTLNPASGEAKPVAASGSGFQATGEVFGLDFNPTVDRVRVVNEAGQNLRLHPETNAVVEVDPALSYDTKDPHAGKSPEVVAAAYTYNKQNDKLTTNFAIDRFTGSLVTQGTREGVAPAVSPNTGRLFTVGSLGLPTFEDVAMDIADTNNKALAAIRTIADGSTRLYTIDLSSGKATVVGTIADGGPLRGLAIEP